MSTLAPVRNSDLQPRIARGSDEYVEDIVRAQEQLKKRTGSTTVSTGEKRMRLAAVLRDENTYLKKLGQGMIGPIQLKLRYQGMTRNVLLEDPLTPGIPVEYDVLDDLGQATVMSGTAGEVEVTPFEGKKVPVGIYRIATQPQVKKEDLWNLRVSAVDYAQDESKQAIMKQEDARLMTLLEASIVSYGTAADHIVSPGAHIVNELSGYITPDSFYDLVSLTDVHELKSARMLFHPADYRDIHRWDLNQTGFAFKDRWVAGEEIQTFGEFQIQRSIMVPEGSVYITPAPNFLGVFPVMYSLDVEENHKLESFLRGWVMDEYVGFAVLNPRGLGRITKP